MNRITVLSRRAAKAVRLVTETVWQLGPAPDLDRVRTLRQLHRALPHFHLPNPPDAIHGWLTRKEQRALYALGRTVPGPILEVGAWLGKSTVCIARGIHDSNVRKEFVTCELGPTLDNFRPVDERTMGFYYPKDAAESMGTAPRELYERDIEPMVVQGIIRQLRANLEAFGVADVVTVFHGDFRESPPRTYGLVFTDAMHDELEIRRNARDLQRFLGPGSILACHDTTIENRRLLQTYFRVGYAFFADSLFVADIEGFR